MLKKLFVKYIIGECRHLCFMCKYRTECDCNYEEQTWKWLLKYYRHSKHIKRVRRGTDYTVQEI